MTGYFSTTPWHHPHCHCVECDPGHPGGETILPIGQKLTEHDIQNRCGPLVLQIGQELTELDAENIRAAVAAMLQDPDGWDVEE